MSLTSAWRVAMTEKSYLSIGRTKLLETRDAGTVLQALARETGEWCFRRQVVLVVLQRKTWEGTWEDVLARVWDQNLITVPCQRATRRFHVWIWGFMKVCLACRCVPKEGSCLGRPLPCNILLSGCPTGAHGMGRSRKEEGWTVFCSYRLEESWEGTPWVLFLHGFRSGTALRTFFTRQDR